MVKPPTLLILAQHPKISRDQTPENPKVLIKMICNLNISKPIPILQSQIQPPILCPKIGMEFDSLNVRYNIEPRCTYQCCSGIKKSSGINQCCLVIQGQLVMYIQNFVQKLDN